MFCFAVVFLVLMGVFYGVFLLLLLSFWFCFDVFWVLLLFFFGFDVVLFYTYTPPSAAQKVAIKHIEWHFL